MIKHDTDKKAIKLVVPGEFYDDATSEETLRYRIDQVLQDLTKMVDAFMLKERPETVRCRDCKFWYKDKCSHACVITGDLRPSNWFCVNAEKW